MNLLKNKLIFLGTHIFIALILTNIICLYFTENKQVTYAKKFRKCKTLRNMISDTGLWIETYQQWINNVFWLVERELK